MIDIIGEEKMDEELKKFINEIRGLETYRQAYYFMKCLKLYTHDGNEEIEIPNFYFTVPVEETYGLFIHFDPTKIPAIFKRLITDVEMLIERYSITMDDLYNLCVADPNYWYESIILRQWSNNKACVLYAFLVKIIKQDPYKFSSVGEIVKLQNLVDANKYGLTKVDVNECDSRTFVYKEQCYHYPLFFNLTRKEQLSSTPQIIDLFKSVPGADVYLICDQNLLCHQGQFSSSVNFEHFRGIVKFEFSHIENLVKGKEVIIHIDYEGKYKGNKLLFVIKSDCEDDNNNNNKFYHVMVESLWNLDDFNQENVMTNYIHAKYFPKDQCFKHIDYSVNEYTLDHYLYKYEDAVNETKTPIDCIADQHYKVWCIENSEISIDHWEKLVCYSLDEPFRHLFLEIVDAELKYIKISLSCVG